MDTASTASAARAAASAPARGAGVGQWKRQVRLFAVLMIALVVGVAAGSAVLMWRLLQQVSAAEQQDEARGQAANATRQAILEVDRLLMKAIALAEPGAVRAAAVASIGAASKLEDAVTELRTLLPDSADAAEMARLVDDVKAPRMQVATLARKGDDAQALETLERIAEPLRRIDELSAAVQQAQAAERQRTAEEREALFHRMLGGLLAASAGGVAFALLFYWRLMKRLARTDEIQRLLGEVNESAEQLDGDGRRLAGLNADMLQANEHLTALLERMRASCGAMDDDTQRALDELQTLIAACDNSMETSRRQAGDAGVVAGQVKATVAQMRGLQQSTEALARSRDQIAGFTESIARISATTRLLSMNAAVEAARAGQAGRGFNVVAMSIRELSESTQKAADEIRRASDDIDGQLATTQQAVLQTGRLMDDCAQRIAALEASALHNRQLIETMVADVQGFRTAFERQTGRVREMDGEVGSLDRVVHEGHSHARLLDGTARALAGASSRMLERLASVQR
jgi:hypothetical protein